jgi:hypothetical protein
MYLIIFFYYKVKINLGDIALEQREFKDALHYFQEIEKLPNSDVYDFKKCFP